MRSLLYFYFTKFGFNFIRFTVTANKFGEGVYGFHEQIFFRHQKNNKKAERFCMKFSSTTNTKFKSAQTTYVKIDISFFYCPRLPKIFSTTRIYKMVNIFLINILVLLYLTSRIHLVILLENSESSICLLNLCLIFSRSSQIYNPTMIGRNF